MNILGLTSKYLSITYLKIQKPLFDTFQMMWIYREISAPVLFVLAQMEPDIRWRTKYFRLKWGGLVEPVEHKIHVWL